MTPEEAAVRPPGWGCLSNRTLSVLRGQLISVLIAGTGVFATLLSKATPNANYPQFMNMLNYILLTVFFYRARMWKECCTGMSFSSRRMHDPLATSSVSKALRFEEQEERETVGRRGGRFDEEREGDEEEEECKDINERGESLSMSASSHRPPLHFGWYVLAAALDVNGNFLFIKAYDYTSITSIMLLDCFTIPSAMTLSYLFLSVRYNTTHLLGIAICVSGIVCIVVSDLYTHNDDSSSNTGTGTDTTDANGGSSSSIGGLGPSVLGDLM